jgi:hypothetical protein
MAAAVVYFTQAIGSSVILINVVTVVTVVATGVGCVGWSVFGEVVVFEVLYEPSLPRRSRGKNRPGSGSGSRSHGR